MGSVVDKGLRDSWVQGECPRIYGPVESRRHGRSLGINLGDTKTKICNWSCLYCQCGLSKKKSEISNPVTSQDLVNELEAKLNQIKELDSVTLAGNCEPTLHPKFLSIVEAIIDLRSKRREGWTFNALSNGSLIADQDKRRGLELLDEFWLKLDCGVESKFKRLNHPSGALRSLPLYLEAISTFRERRIQTLLWRDSFNRGFGNDDHENLEALIKAYQQIDPTEVHLTTIERRPPLDGLEPVAEDFLERFMGEVENHKINIQVFPNRKEPTIIQEKG